jgi:hypothetical protein
MKNYLNSQVKISFVPNPNKQHVNENADASGFNIRGAFRRFNLNPN